MYNLMYNTMLPTSRRISANGMARIYFIVDACIELSITDLNYMEVSLFGCVQNTVHTVHRRDVMLEIHIW